MTEADWLTYTDPTPMVEYLRGHAGGRRLPLFAFACCQRSRDLLAGSVRVPDRLRTGWSERPIDWPRKPNDRWVGQP